MLEGFFFFFGPDVGGGGRASGWVLKITRLKNEIKQIYSVISSKFRKDLQDYNGTQKKTLGEICVQYHKHVSVGKSEQTRIEHK